MECINYMPNNVRDFMMSEIKIIFKEIYLM